MSASASSNASASAGLQDALLRALSQLAKLKDQLEAAPAPPLTRNRRRCSAYAATTLGMEKPTLRRKSEDKTGRWAARRASAGEEDVQGAIAGLGLDSMEA